VARYPMTTREIAYQMIVERALNREDQKLMNLMCKRVGVALRHQRDSGRAECSQGPGQYMLWRLVKQRPDQAADAFATDPSRFD